MSTFSKIMYTIMYTVGIIAMIEDYQSGKGLTPSTFDVWKFNTLCWVAIAHMNEIRYIREQKKNQE
jgi:hypothetical protein